MKKLRTITVFDKYNYSDNRFLIIVPNGLEPVYRVLVWANGKSVKVVIDAINDTVLYEEDYVLACSNCSTSLGSNMPDVLTTLVSTIVTSITAGIVLSKKIYK